MKGVGVLHLFKNRELALSAHEDSNFGMLTAEELLRARNKERNDLSFIDSASAVLSRGGGHAFSIKAGTLDMISLITPPTKNPSVASSAFASNPSRQPTRNPSISGSEKFIGGNEELRKDSLWKKYKAKNEERERKHDEESRKALSKYRSGSQAFGLPMSINGLNMKTLNQT
jgi:hypothetical protein